MGDLFFADEMGRVDGKGAPPLVHTELFPLMIRLATYKLKITERCKAGTVKTMKQENRLQDQDVTHVSALAWQVKLTETTPVIGYDSLLRPK